MSGVGPNSATEAVLNPGASPSPTATASAAPLQAGEQVILQPVPTDGATAVATPIPTPTASPSESVKAADELAQAVGQQSQTVGDVIQSLQGMSIDVGSITISVWSGIVFIAVTIGVFAFAFFGSKLAHLGLARVTRLDQTRRLLAEKIVTIGVWGMAILIGIDLLGIDLTALTVFSGAFGLAIGFGLQKTFGNLIAGIILLMDKSIKPGDVIAIADQAGVSTFGQIRKIGIRAVSITTRDQKEYLIPNENLMINQVENWSYSSRNVRMQVPVGISYHADIDKAEELMLEAALSCDRVLKSPPPTVWLDGYGDSSVNFIIHVWITDPEAGTGNVKSAVLKKLWHLFQEHEVEIPFPQRDINLRNAEGLDQLIAALQQTRAKSDKPQTKE
ncbi:mechanosensitive ion channel [Erythrobacter sp. YJ-T3-07]|uniref:mechanosensitive ion channel domain-containing protein n=1 Tax=Erythrobacter sp. YJ-T3-07 TaxID=2793063 RepID=UPI0018D28732|nr:mechanosensitive ion channel domain-containing protein [Erythrobacter sp. YJ-T3-07]MBH1944708.1 mechanosensitive ion channel [Erythrobacter sp. YJ-T3-07]